MRLYTVLNRLATKVTSHDTSIASLNSNYGSGKIIQTVYAVTPTGVDITIENGYRGYLWTFDSSTNGLGLFFVMATGSGEITLLAIKDASKIVHTETTNNLNLKSTSGSIRALLTKVTA